MRFLTRTILLAVIFTVGMAAQVLCPVCVEKELKSTVRPGMSTRTTMGWDQYYDEKGVYHSDDPNISTTEWYCSRGHEWISECQGGDCTEAITKDTEDEPIKVPKGAALFGNEAVIPDSSVTFVLAPLDPNAGRLIEFFPEDGSGKIPVYASVNEGFKIYPDEGPHIVIHPNCSVTINRNSSIEEMFAELVRLIAAGKRLCGSERSAGPAFLACEAACPDGTLCGCVEPNTGTKP